MTTGFDFIDLFAGVGGFHAVLAALGGRCVLAAEIDPWASAVYERNWDMRPQRDVVEVARNLDALPNHVVMAGGFPCQPFSKGGHQRGMSEIRGQMVNEILRILTHHKPAVIFLENVRNIAGPRQRQVWDAVLAGLREAGYRVPNLPTIFSPHLLPRHLGGGPQVRERVYILGTYVGPDRARREVDAEPVVLNRPVDGWDPQAWDLNRDVLLRQHEIPDLQRYEIGADELAWIRVWNDFLETVRPARLPGFPLWSSYWHDSAEVDPDAPGWKQVLERHNIRFYKQHRSEIRRWLRRSGPELRSFPASRQKLEWQAQDSIRRLDQCLLHLRPSGIRAKRPTYTPALVAMAQTPIYGPEHRRLTPRETARLQGFPDWFDFGDQPETKSYKQMGNAIHIGAAYYAMRRHVERDAEEIEQLEGGEALVRAVKDSPELPDLEALAPTSPGRRS